MIKEYEFYHGAVFTRLMNSCSPELCITAYSGKNYNSYRLGAGNRSAGLYIKYSTKRLAPWSFTFTAENQYEILEMKLALDEVFLILVCGQDGIVTLNYQEIKQILDDNYHPTEWVSVTRRKNQMYAVKGKDGALDFKVGDAEFSRKILDYLTKPPLATNEFQDDLCLHALTKSA